MTEKVYTAIMFGNADNHTTDTYNLYNTYINRVKITRDVKWAEWKRTDKEYLVPGIEEENIPTSYLENKLPVHVTPNEG